MLYSLQAGGKRLRPVLCLSCAALCGLEPQKALPFAAAIEMIHTYSLIHDDLPAMDDDDLRRGKPSNHKAFDEATAILAGDGLLTDAFVIMCRAPLPPDRLLRAVAELALAAGASGMVGGQEWDMIYTGRSRVSLEELRGMHAMKTGALLRASCVCGGLLAGAEDKALRAISDLCLSPAVAFRSPTIFWMWWRIRPRWANPQAATRSRARIPILPWWALRRAQSWPAPGLTRRRRRWRALPGRRPISCALWPIIP